MQKDAVYERFLAHQSKVSLSAIRGRRGTSIWEEEELENANRKLREIKNLIFYTGTFTASKIRQIVERDKLDVVIIDYLQLLKSDGHYNNRASEVGEISHAIKAIAMDFDIPIFPLVQLNRAVEMRDDKEPTLSDIRESGDIEQDASQVIFLWTIPNQNDKDDTSSKGCRVAKNRNGQLGSVRFKFNGEVMRFEIVPKAEKPPARSTKESMSYAFTKPLPEDQYGFNTSVTEDELPFA
jgi:replicative DNA helicase